MYTSHKNKGVELVTGYKDKSLVIDRSYGVVV